MRNKILIIAEEGEKGAFEQILEEFLRAGGELFFAEKKEAALEIIQSEHPPLVFIDSHSKSLIEGVSFEPARVIWIVNRHEILPNVETIEKPLRPGKVIEKCAQVFGALRTPIPPISPM